MRFRIRELAAALVAVFATTLAFAQATTYAEAPVATVATGTQAANIGAANAIVEALNADTSLEDTKITVTPEETKILLTGVTPTVQQMGRILQVASQHAGDQVVVNGLATEEVFIAPNPTGEAAQTEQLADAGDAAEGQAEQASQAGQAGQAAQGKPSA